MKNNFSLDTRDTMKALISKIVRYFFSGLVLVVPIMATIYLMQNLISWADGLLNVDIPGLGLLIVVIAVTFLGMLASILIVRPVFEWMDSFLTKIPVVNFIYSSVKDVMDAFVGQKKKFTEPVAVEMSDSGILKLGFVTSKDLERLFDKSENEYLAVYFPHSYNFSGNLFLVPSDRVRHLKGKSSDIMKFVVSGGVIDLPELDDLLNDPE